MRSSVPFAFLFWFDICWTFFPQELGTDTNLYALVFGESILNDAVCMIFHVYLVLHNYMCNWFSNLHLIFLTDADFALGLFLDYFGDLEDGHFPVQVCFRGLTFSNFSYFLWKFRLKCYYFRTMASVRSNASAGQNFILVVLRFLETFVGSLSSGQDQLLHLFSLPCF